MLTQYNRHILKEAGQKYLFDIAIDSQVLKKKLTFIEHVELCNSIYSLTYEEIIGLTITEDIKEFESKFKKFLKYSLATIASAITLGPLAPPIAMFILYLFRKMTDTCSRRCIRMMPTSIKRKICRYECQVNACRQIVNKLRSEISRCSTFSNSDKCEKKLKKEFIKWSKRLQQQIIKLQQAKLGVEEKKRKLKSKELSKKIRTITNNYNLPKSQLMKIVVESKRLRQSIPFRNHLKMYQRVTALKENEYTINPPKIDPAKEKYARQALYLGLWIIPIPFFNDVVNYIIKKYNFACVGKCLGQKKYSKILCIHQCSYLSAQYGVQLLKKQLSKCNKSNNPVKCKKKIYSLLEDWKQREIEAKIKFQSSLRNEMRKAKEREGKQ